jgi:hypothetical protein
LHKLKEQSIALPPHIFEGSFRGCHGFVPPFFTLFVVADYFQLSGAEFAVKRKFIGKRPPFWPI